MQPFVAAVGRLRKRAVLHPIEAKFGVLMQWVRRDQVGSSGAELEDRLAELRLVALLLLGGRHPRWQVDGLSLSHRSARSRPRGKRCCSPTFALSSLPQRLQESRHCSASGVFRARTHAADGR